ncbi:MAG: hypothetical protein JXR96_07780, partial [Deltaproteobacteria bacterium]|nr:hypothetical protein [Deltaproteobacteria bacterium]
ASAQWCNSGACDDCDTSQHCGPSCVSCTGHNGNACVNGACGCTSDSHCFFSYVCNMGTHRCVLNRETHCYDNVDEDLDGNTDCEDDDCDAEVCNYNESPGAICYQHTCRWCDTYSCSIPDNCPPGCNGVCNAGSCAMY